MLLQEGKHALLLVGDERQSIYHGGRGQHDVTPAPVHRGKEDRRRDSSPDRIVPLWATDCGSRHTHSFARLQAGPDHHRPRIDNPQSDGGHCCYLSRTNTGPMMGSLHRGKSSRRNCAFRGHQGSGLSPRLAYKFDFIRSVYGHFAGQPYLVTDPEIKRFVDSNNILRHGTSMDASKNEAVDQELAAAIKFVTKYTSATPQMLDRIEASCDFPEYAVASFSTAHRAKGPKWERVTLSTISRAWMMTTRLLMSRN